MGPIVVLLYLAIFCNFSPPTQGHHLKICRFDRIYNFGDSLSDTGNLVHESYGANTAFARNPYGHTFFTSSTGRCSDGLLMIDFIAISAGLPPLPSYKNMGINFNAGVNFAVAGATALPSEILSSKHIVNPLTNSSLNVQMKWLMDHFNLTTLDASDLAENIRTALFLVGEIGGNDYNYGFLQGRTIPELRELTPQIVETIIGAAQNLIKIGALKLIIPGNIPIGCLPLYRTLFKSKSSSAYDGNNCLKNLNDFVQSHNSYLQKGIRKLKIQNPDVVIVYGDYYNAYMYLLTVAKERGYNSGESCCGIGGDCNFDMDRQCGHPDAKICTDPTRYLSWDGTHLTQRAYSIMAKWLLQDLVSKLKCGS